MRKKVLSYCLLSIVTVLLMGMGCPLLTQPHLKIGGGLMLGDDLPGDLHVLQVNIHLEDRNTGNSVDLTASNGIWYGRGWFNADLSNAGFTNNFNQSSDFDITVVVIEPETGDTVTTKQIRIPPPAKGWGFCSAIFFDIKKHDYETSEIPTGTVQGTVIDGRTQKPIGTVSVFGHPNNAPPYVTGVTNPWGSFKLTNFLPGPGHAVANFALDAGFLAEENPDYLRTFFNFVLPQDEGLEIGPIAVMSREDWDSLSSTMKETYGIEQDSGKGLILGSVRNRSGLAIPDAVVSLDPASGQAVYFDPVEWDTASSTKVLYGYHLSAGYAIVNAEPYFGGYDHKVTAVHRITGDTIGSAENLKVSPFSYAINQVDIIADDDTPPAAITDLSIEENGGITLSWTAPGDDGTQGNACAYDVRYSEEPIGTDTFDWWYNKAESVDDPPTPSSPGSTETLVLEPGYPGNFMVRARDECMNWSGFSNSVAGTEEFPKSEASAFDLVISPISSKGDVRIQYSVPRKSTVNLSIYSADGRKVTTLLSGSRPAGIHTVIWNPPEASPGLYFCRLEVEGLVLTEKIVLFR